MMWYPSASARANALKAITRGQGVWGRCYVQGSLTILGAVIR